MSSDPTQILNVKEPEQIDVLKRPAEDTAVPDVTKRPRLDTSADLMIQDLSRQLDNQSLDEDKRAQLEYELRNAYDIKYQAIQSNLSTDKVTQQLRENPDTSEIARSIDLQMQYVLDAMRSPGDKFQPNIKEIKAAYAERYQQLQAAKERLYDASVKVNQVRGQADMENYYKAQMIETLQSLDGSNSVLAKAQAKYGDAVQDEQNMVGAALQRFSFIQSIFSPNAKSMSAPENQMAYTIRNKDQRRGRRLNEKKYDVSQLPLLMDTKQMAKDVLNRTSGDTRELFNDTPFNKWADNTKEEYANYTKNTYDNEVEKLGETLFSKDPSEMTPDELTKFSKFKDAYVVENDHKHYLVTRDDPQWTDEDARQFARQIANEGGNEYYEPEPWEVALSWVTAGLGLALGVAALPLGATAAGLAAGAASAAIGVASMGMPPVGGPEWLHKLFTALSITTAGASLLQGGYAVASAVRAARVINPLAGVSSTVGTFGKALDFVDELPELANAGSVFINRPASAVAEVGQASSWLGKVVQPYAPAAITNVVDQTANIVSQGRNLGYSVLGKFGSYFTKPVTLADEAIQMTDILGDISTVQQPAQQVARQTAQQAAQFRTAILNNPNIDELVVSLRQGGSVMTNSAKNALINGMNRAYLGRLSPFVGSVIDKLGDALLGTVVTRDTVATVVANAQTQFVDAAVAAGVPSADVLGEIIPDTVVAIGRYARNPALNGDVVAEALTEKLFRWASTDATTAKYALQKLYQGAVGAKDAVLRIGTKLLAKAITGSELTDVAKAFVEAIISTGSLGVTGEAAKAAIQEFQDKVSSYMDMTDSLKPLLGDETVNYAQDAIINALSEKITTAADKLFENQTNGFAEAFTDATGMSLQNVIDNYANGIRSDDKSSGKSDQKSTEESNLLISTIAKTVERALPKPLKNLGIADILQRALGNQTLSGAAEDLLGKVQEQVLKTVSNKLSNEKLQSYLQEQFGIDVSAKIFELINSLDMLYGDLPSEKIQDIQKALIQEQFKFVMKKLPNTTRTFVSDVDEKYFKEAAKYAYATDNAPEHIGPFTLIYKSDTIKAYLDPYTKRIMLGIRGTADTRDVKAWVPTGIGMLTSTDRYAYDNEQLKSIFVRYSPSEYTFYIAGHSLGGALSTQFKRDYPFIRNAVVYNSATSPKDIINRADTSILRNYIANDALYNLQGGVLAAGTVFGKKTKSNTGISALDTVLDLYGLVEGHKMDNFFVDERRSSAYNY